MRSRVASFPPHYFYTRYGRKTKLDHKIQGSLVSKLIIFKHSISFVIS